MSNRIREHFGNIDEVVEAPNLIGIQIQSYADFLISNVKLITDSLKDLD